MANSDGSRIFIGISDNGDIVGIENLYQLDQWISNAASQKIKLTN